MTCACVTKRIENRTPAIAEAMYTQIAATGECYNIAHRTPGVGESYDATLFLGWCPFCEYRT